MGIFMYSYTETVSCNAAVFLQVSFSFIALLFLQKKIILFIVSNSLGFPRTGFNTSVRVLFQSFAGCSHQMQLVGGRLWSLREEIPR